MPRKEDPIIRFWRFVKKTETCWLWTGARTNFGHGVFKNKIATGNLAHRFSYALHFESIPSKKMILHKCDNPDCVNPEHLYLGNHKDNMRDVALRKRHWNTKKTACKNGHRFNPENIYMTKYGRRCRECILIKRKKLKEYRILYGDFHYIPKFKIVWAEDC